MNFDINSSYGRLLVERLESHPLAVSGGRILMVAPTTHPNYGSLQQIFIPDAEGLPRLFTSLSSALSSAVADRGDLIFLAEGYTETITAAAGSGITKAGVRIIGLGDGANRPTFTFTTSTAASFDLTAARAYIYNCIFTCGITSQTAMLNVTAANVKFDSCTFNLATASVQPVLGILTTAAANGLTVSNCQFLGTSDAGTTAAICFVGGTGVTISGNVFYGAYSSGVGAIQNITTASTNLTVRDNVINNFTASCTKAMVFVAGSTGNILNNRMQILSGTAPITGAGMSWVGGNYYATTAVATAGTLI